MVINLRQVATHYINLKSQPKRRRSIEQELEKCKIERRQLHSAHPGGIVGCAKSHHAILSCGHPNLVILEDDCIVRDGYTPLIEVPSDADAVYLGVSSYGRWGRTNGKVICSRFDDRLSRIYNMLSTHAILYLSRRYIDACAKAFGYCGYERSSIPLDVGAAWMQPRFNVYAFHDPLFYQTSQRSCTELNLEGSTDVEVRHYRMFMESFCDGDYLEILRRIDHTT